jgi:hypothetical protein
MKDKSRELFKSETFPWLSKVSDRGFCEAGSFSGFVVVVGEPALLSQVAKLVSDWTGDDVD